MSGIIRSLRRLIHNVPSNRMERVRTVRRDIIDFAESNDWDWSEIEVRAQEAYQRLDQDEMPKGGDALETHIRDTCQKYHSHGYPWDDIKDGMDAVKARASAKQSM